MRLGFKVTVRASSDWNVLFLLHQPEALSLAFGCREELLLGMFEGDGESSEAVDLLYTLPYGSCLMSQCSFLLPYGMTHLDREAANLGSTSPPCFQQALRLYFVLLQFVADTRL